ncbi:uncharacterized protein LOC121861054 [Homarus americanus]|uniref:uncharacterized protein LOC121861054 n=1 Tax=Homarus americanus TaxID=6706 RepID=UPI001C4850B6|nr:uncharacterized protein LOC121861054 [Homarus americanus]
MNLRLPSVAIFCLATMYVILLMSPMTFADVTRHCYNFTWPGTNTSLDCDEKKLDDNNKPIPCLYPLVYTVPYYNPPNITALELYCTKNVCPDFKCNEKDKKCISYSWYDVNDRLANYSLFCGSLADHTNADDPTVKSSGCWEQRVGTHTRKVCVCDDHDYCNAAFASYPVVSFGLFLMMLLPVVVEQIAKTSLY